MDGKVIQLAHSTTSPVTPPINEDLVTKLESILAEAKEGRIQGMAIACWTSDYSGKTAFSTGGHSFELLGVLDWVHARLLQETVND